MIYEINDKSTIEIAIGLLNKGHIIVCPTDTLYGFSVDATNSLAIKKLNLLKDRVAPYSIILDEINMIKKYAICSSNIMEKIKKKLPGPYTAILNKKSNTNLSKLVTLDFGTVGIRIPENNFVCKLVQKFKKPIITTSVNAHSEDSLNTINDISKTFSKITIFKDSKSNDNSLGSTIIDYTKKPEVVLRLGDGAIN